MNLIDKILEDWAYRVHDGMPNLNNPLHMINLEESLNELNLPKQVIIKVLEKVRTYKDNAKNRKLNRVGKEYGSTGDDVVTKDVDKEKDVDVEKTSDTSEIPAQRIYKNKNPLDFENDSIDDIAKKTSNGPFKRITSEQASQQTKENRKLVFSGKKTGKGGGDTTVQEEMGNMAKEIGFKASNKSDEEVENEIWDSIKDTEWAKKKGEDSARKLIRKSTGGMKTAKNMMTDESFNYNKEQPEGYPSTTTEGDIVRNAVLTKYEEAKKSGDEEAIKHYQEELKWFQKKAGDKSITGTEGDADTVVMFYDNNGRMRTAYVTNKQSEGDMISNSTINTVTMATEASAVEGADIGAVTRVQRAAMETGQGFNDRYVKKSQEVIKNNREDLKNAGDIIGKLTMFEGGRSEYHDGKKPNVSYLKDNLKNKGVQERLRKAGIDPEKVKKNPEKYANQVMQASLDAHGTDVEGIGTGAQGIAYSTVKATKATRSVRTKVKSLMNKNPNMSLEEACKTVAESKTGKKGKEKPLFGGKLSGDEVLRIMNNKGLEALEEEQVTRQNSMDGMYEESVNRLRETDLQYYIDEEGLSPDEAMEKMKTTPGPNEKSYTAGYLHRTHLQDYINGTVDGRVLGEMGTNSHSPQRMRKALAGLLNYEGDTENPKEFMNFVLNNVRADHESQTLTFIDAKGNDIEIGKDAHRLAGRNEKMAGQFGSNLQKKLKELAKEEG